jgi:hypothetical protein
MRFCPHGKGGDKVYFSKKGIAFSGAAVSNCSGRKLLDPLPLGRLIGSSRPSLLFYERIIVCCRGSRF